LALTPARFWRKVFVKYDFLIETYETERIKVISALEHVL
jgi:hypothetical protein